jgi:hypothetical protein
MPGPGHDQLPLQSLKLTPMVPTSRVLPTRFYGGVWLSIVVILLLNP